MKNKKGFTLIELMVVVSIISILATLIFVLISQSRIKARINAVKASVKTTLPAIVACREGSGIVSNPIANNSICGTPGAGLVGANWPILYYGYTYGVYNSGNCSFLVNTNTDVTPLGNTYLTCSCITQQCD